MMKKKTLESILFIQLTILFIITSGVVYFMNDVPDSNMWQGFGNFGDGLSGTIGLSIALVGTIAVWRTLRVQVDINKKQEVFNREVQNNSRMQNYIALCTHFSNTIRQDIINVDLTKIEYLLAYLEEDQKQHGFTLLRQPPSATTKSSCQLILDSIDSFIRDIQKFKTEETDRKILKSIVGSGKVYEFHRVLEFGMKSEIWKKNEKLKNFWEPHRRISDELSFRFEPNY
ncbi:MAG: hypothetical protein ABIV51_09490 [Saprospiraceae bacterium]